ncbi:DUF6542 domain-containing protein [Streptomyces sp. NRRL S-1521]|uniref:DUF6542 domain-containing protein n=1 Tax=Streptomyces sp. NRRL S-1521 TaxID=1609100 RepID=UPI000A8FAC01
MARPRRSAPLPSQGRAARPGGTARRTAPRPRRPAPPLVRALRRAPLVRALRRMPNPRLTGLGSGLFCTGALFLLACLLGLVFDDALVAYGVLFLPVATFTALWVRPADLVTAPISVPIAFAAGVLPISGGTGFGGRLMGLVTSLALHAGWLYGGTLIAGLVVGVRKIRLMAERRGQVGQGPARKETAGPGPKRAPAV